MATLSQAALAEIIDRTTTLEGGRLHLCRQLISIGDDGPAAVQQSLSSVMQEAEACITMLADDRVQLLAHIAALEGFINSPQTVDFLEAVKSETAHQRQRWGEAHDRSKSAENWYWLVGWLAGKALRAHIDGDVDKAKHHTISTAAALRQWHAFMGSDQTGCGVGDDADLKAIEAT